MLDKLKIQVGQAVHHKEEELLKDQEILKVAETAITAAVANSAPAVGTTNSTDTSANQVQTADAATDFDLPASAEIQDSEMDFSYLKASGAQKLALEAQNDAIRQLAMFKAAHIA